MTAGGNDVTERLRDMSILICGQRFTSRTETLEKYFVNYVRTLGVIANAGVRQTQNSNCRLYENGALTKNFDMPGFHLKGESFLFTLVLGFYFLSFFKNFFTAYRKLGIKFDLFIGVQVWSTFLGILLKKMGKVDRVIYYSIDYYKPTTRFGSRIESFVFRQLDGFCCRNADMIWDLAPHFRQDRKEDSGIDYGDKEIYVQLTYSESLLMNRSLDDIDRHSAAFIGTLESEQGWEVFINSIPILLQTYPDFKVHIFGDGSYRPAIVKLIEQAGVQNSVIMHGFINDELELLKQLSRCAVGIAPYLPHKAEYAGLDSGKPKLYALVGLPIIMTRTEYIESQFQKSKTGKTFQYDPKSLAETVIEVVSNDEKLKEYKNNASQFARRFTSESVFPEALEKTFAFMAEPRQNPARAGAPAREPAGRSKGRLVWRFWPYYIMLALAMSVFAPGIFVPDGFFNYGDFAFPFNPEKRWNLSFSILDYSVVPNRVPYYQGFLPALSVIHGLNSAGVPMWFINHALLVSAAFLASVAIYRLGTVLINNPASKVPALLGGAFAVLNPSFIYHDPLLEIAYAGVFLTMSFFIMGLRTMEKKYYLIVAFSSLLTIWNPLAFLILVTLAFGYFALYHLFQLKRPSRQALLYLGMVSFFTFSFNLFWLGTPVYLQLTGFDVAGSYTNPITGREGLLVLRSTSLDSTIGGSLTLSFNHCFWCDAFYSDPNLGMLRALASFAPLAVGIWALTIKFADVNLKIFLLITLLLITLSLGIHYVLTGSVYKFLWDNLVGFKGIRDTNHMFYTLAFTYSAILALGSYYLLSYLKKRKQHIVTLVLAAAIVFNGSILYVYGPEKNFSAHASPFFIPNDYLKLRDYMLPDVDTGYKALMLPLAGGGVTYTWYGVKSPGMQNIIIDYVPLPVVAVATVDLTNIAYGENIDKSILLLHSVNTLDLAAEMLGSQGIKYIVIQNDIDNTSIRDLAGKYAQRLSDRPDLFHKVDGFTNFSIFVLDEKHLAPHLRLVQPDPEASAQMKDTLIPIDRLSLSPRGSITLADENAFIETSSSNLHNISDKFTLLLWVKTPEETQQGPLLSSSSVVARNVEGERTLLPVYSLVANSDRSVTFSLLGRESDVILKTAPLSAGAWHLLAVTGDESHISVIVDGASESTTARNYALNTPVYEGNSALVVGKSRYFDGGAPGFSFSKLVIYAEEVPSGQLRSTFEQGPDAFPHIDRLVTGAWDFQSPNRNVGVSGYVTSEKGIEILLEHERIIPFSDFVRGEVIDLASADHGSVNQQASVQLASLDYSIDVSDSTDGYIILNSDYDPNWKLKDASGRQVDSLKIADEWNVWRVSSDMQPPFSVWYDTKEVVPYSIAISVALTVAGAVIVKRFFGREIRLTYPRIVIK